MQKRNNGIVFFNAGEKCIVRLIVAIYSLKEHYDGDITLISMGDESHNHCEYIADYFNCNLIKLDKFLYIDKYYWYEKSRINEYSSYDNTLFIDSDTLTQKNPSILFEEIEKEDFIVPQFSDWTVEKGIIKNRLNKWKDIDSKLLEKTLQSGMESVNVGVYGFNKNSELMKNWFNFTIQKTEDVTLPEESTCHLLLNKYKGKIIDSLFNYSCKHEKKNVNDAYIIHYHGRKHCRIDEDGNILFNANKWINKFMKMYNINICNIKHFVNVIEDKKLDVILCR